MRYVLPGIAFQKWSRIKYISLSVHRSDKITLISWGEGHMKNPFKKMVYSIKLLKINFYMINLIFIKLLYKKV